MPGQDAATVELAARSSTLTVQLLNVDSTGSLKGSSSPWLWNAPVAGKRGSWRIAQVQSEYFGRRENGLRRSMQWRLSLEVEVRLVGCVIDWLGVRLGNWIVGEEKAMGASIADSERKR